MNFLFDVNHRWTEKPELFGEVSKKMYAIANNLGFVLDQMRVQFPDDEELYGIPASEPLCNYIYGIDQIVVDFHNATDEFYVEQTNTNICIHIEVVTKEVAEGNDQDWLRGDNRFSNEEKATYKVGEILSDYRKLADTEYYFKFM